MIERKHYILSRYEFFPPPFDFLLDIFHVWCLMFTTKSINQLTFSSFLFLPPLELYFPLFQTLWLSPILSQILWRNWSIPSMRSLSLSSTTIPADRTDDPIFRSLSRWPEVPRRRFSCWGSRRRDKSRNRPPQQRRLPLLWNKEPMKNVVAKTEVAIGRHSNGVYHFCQIRNQWKM